MPSPLHGFKVLDLTRILAGPYCTMLLCDLGAEVVKVERPEGGDISRGSGPYIDGLSTFFLSLNRGKKSITLDMSNEKGKAILIDLARRADVLVENFVPGAMAKLGLDYASLSKHNPRLVYCAISGFGQTGPYAQRRALDVVVQGMGGIMSITGEGPGRPPVRPGISLGDIAAGAFAAMGIMSALLERASSGKGQMVDISMLDCQVALMENAYVRHFATGEAPQPLGSRHPVVTPVQAFHARDGWIVVAIIGGVNDQWPLFCATIGRLDLLDDDRFRTSDLRTHNYAVLEPIFDEALEQKTTEEWLRAFSEVGIACGPVNTVDKAAKDPQILSRGMFVDLPYPKSGAVRVVNSPIKLSRTPAAVERISPELGEHTEKVLEEWLGLRSEDVRALRKQGVV